MRAARAVAAALGLVALAVAPVRAQSTQLPAAIANGAIKVEEHVVEIDVRATDFPAPGASSTFYAKAKAPFTVSAAIPYAGTWFLQVTLLTSPRIAGGIASLTPEQVEYRAIPLLGSNVSGCMPTPVDPRSIPWTPVGSGSRATVLEGPGICRMSIEVRLKLDGREPPGAYHADLAWTLVHEPR